MKHTDSGRVLNIMFHCITFDLDPHFGKPSISDQFRVRQFVILSVSNLT